MELFDVFLSLTLFEFTVVALSESYVNLTRWWAKQKNVTRTSAVLAAFVSLSVGVGRIVSGGIAYWGSMGIDSQLNQNERFSSLCDTLFLPTIVVVLLILMIPWIIQGRRQDIITGESTASSVFS